MHRRISIFLISLFFLNTGAAFAVETGNKEFVKPKIRLNANTPKELKPARNVKQKNEKEKKKLEKATKENKNKKVVKKITKKDFSYFKDLRFKDFVVLPSNTGDKKETLKYRDTLAKEYKDHGDVYSIAIEYGLTLIDLGEYDLANKVLERAKKDFIGNPTPIAYKAWVDAIQGRYVEAKEAWLPVAKSQYKFAKGNPRLLPWLPHQVISVVGLYLIQDKLPKADKKEIQEITKLLPEKLNHPHFSAILCSQDFKKKKLESCASRLSNILARYPKDPLSITLLGVTQLVIGEYAEALNLFEKAIEFNSEIPTSQYMRAKALFALGNTNLGMKALDKTIELDPEWELPKLEKKKYLASNK